MASSDSEDERSIITYYFTRGFKYDSIVEFLEKYHNIKMSVRTLKTRLRQYDLKRKQPSYDLDHVRERICQELSGPGSQKGYRSMCHTLRLENIQVPRHVVAQLMREIDPNGCEQRKSRRLTRRKYLSPGPNFTWHVDGYDKLKPYGFPIHGCIDGWSRRIMWLRVTRTNNDPQVVASFYLDCVDKLGGCPVNLRTDCGTENGIMAGMQCEFRQDIAAHKYGSSPANQRIEGWWSFFRRSTSNWWIDFFKGLIYQGVFNHGNQLQMECIWFCFSGLIQTDLDQLIEHWNSHFIRASGYNTISGRPDELYLIPERHGGDSNLIVPVTDAHFATVQDMCTDVKPTIQQEYFAHVLENSTLELPKDWEEALTLYNSLLKIAAQGHP